MSYYINKNEDILISDSQPKGFYPLKHLVGGMQNITLYSGLFLYCKACDLADYSGYETSGAAIVAKMKEYGVEIPKDFFYGGLTNYLLSMNTLSLSCLWGNNSTSIKRKGDVLIPNEYIKECVDDYSTERVEEFISGLIKDGIIDSIK